jgi:prepilin-type N-terminal cleavage/methylation domain-containing protein
VSRLRLLRREQGYTIVEVMAALVVFALVTVAVVPLLSTSIRSSLLGNTYAVGKNLTVQAMERIRGLPYFISYTAQSGKVDVLDLYFPDKTSATAEQRYTASDPAYTFTTTCTSEASANPACPKNLPAGYTVIVSAQFVTPVDSGTETTSYTPAEPAEIGRAHV